VYRTECELVFSRRWNYMILLWRVDAEIVVVGWVMR